MEKFHCKTKLITGAGAIAALKEMNIGKLFLVCDPFFQKTDWPRIFLVRRKARTGR